MSHLRPARRVPAGSREWEIYVYRIRFPRVALPDLGSGDPTWDYGLGGPLLWLLMEAPLLVARVIIALGAVVASLPAAIIAAARSEAIYVQAIDFSGASPESFLWSTTPAHRDDVVDEIAANLRLGRTPRPSYAVLQETRP
jgi:hypothetical protein